MNKIFVRFNARLPFPKKRNFPNFSEEAGFKREINKTTFEPGR